MIMLLCGIVKDNQHLTEGKNDPVIVSSLAKFRNSFWI